VSDWAPYRYGRWSYVRPWGWTWIDDASWGFAPFHYGRWVQVRDRWCWWPGAYQARPVYAPALVAWYGRPGAGINISTGPAVGWFPLGPREHYVPHYSNNNGYIRRLNHIAGNDAVVRPPSTYRNHLQGATFVPNSAFLNGGHVGANASRVNPRTIADQGNFNQAGMQPGPRGRITQTMPDRAQGAQGLRGGLAGGSVPSPQFVHPSVTPPAGNITPSPSNRPGRDKAHPEPANGGPMPTPGPAPAYPQKQNAQPNRGGALPVPPANASVPAVPASPVEPRGRRERTQPAAPVTPTPAPDAAAQRTVQPAATGTTPDRENRARQPRSQRPGDPANSTSATQHSAPVQQAPRQPVQPAAPRVTQPAQPASPHAKPPAETTTKPREEQSGNGNAPRGEGRRPAVSPN
jgi:hypothetical protein